MSSQTENWYRKFTPPFWRQPWWWRNSRSWSANGKCCDGNKNGHSRDSEIPVNDIIDNFQGAMELMLQASDQEFLQFDHSGSPFDKYATRFFDAMVAFGDVAVTIFVALHLLLQAQRKNGRCWDILEKVPWNWCPKPQTKKTQTSTAPRCNQR